MSTRASVQFGDNPNTREANPQQPNHQSYRSSAATTTYNSNNTAFDSIGRTTQTQTTSANDQLIAQALRNNFLKKKASVQVFEDTPHLPPMASSLGRLPDQVFQDTSRNRPPANLGRSSGNLRLTFSTHDLFHPRPVDSRSPSDSLFNEDDSLFESSSSNGLRFN